MKAKDPQLVDVLNDVLSAELTAINQYFVHAKMCGNWGYKRLHAFIRHESIDEMKHAEAIMERILFLDGVPNLQRLYKLNVGETVDEQFQSDVALEYAAVERLNKGIQLATAAGDNTTRALLEKILVSEEEHIDWLETQLETIRQVGLPNYLTQQIRE
ncbi:MAG: bacterioferritin [Pseudomonadota bacterium]|nr:bacterioferritin [Pseudomonadota bacterium]